ncbi:precorrin-8X methylmutase [Alkaliphilus peptidifermentans]|uniref:Precorrin-8X methylmutase n=1 Tax=Alkaliphilus peptidifermentans DSM 18978 TaxID=1120976 RepID=A0A1G5AQU9_9FIRM|nr:precorrin-8X methylmutase [Alkaliphilus peptidifermentans]SCX80255.1 precorrin-8X methylmutase [Alkaliphilus peptidifermentans DSM 18978]
MEYIKEPMEIEERSFKIITEELGDKVFEEREGKIIKRIIHTTADFEFADITVIHSDAVEAALEALNGGCRIYTDTKMALSGINKKKLTQLNCQVYCLVDDEEVAKEAKDRGITRSIVAMEKALTDKETKIFVIANAPTALFTLCQQMKVGEVKPYLVVGVPVGFVGASESKEVLLKQNVPYITVKGRKGGSTVGAAIINALMYMIE